MKFNFYTVKFNFKLMNFNAVKIFNIKEIDQKIY